jgi:hypothetical protein
MGSELKFRVHLGQVHGRARARVRSRPRARAYKCTQTDTHTHTERERETDKYDETATKHLGTQTRDTVAFPRSTVDKVASWPCLL